MLAAAPPAATLPLHAGSTSSAVNGPFRCDPPLHVVAQLGCVAVGESLLSHGADVNLMSAITGDTPLLRAICHGCSDFIRLLHAHAADWLKAGRGGISPCVLASITQNAAATECCLDAGIMSPIEISSLDLLRALLAFPSVDAVTAAACNMLLLQWERGGCHRCLVESLMLQWFGLLLVSSSDAGAPSPIVGVLSASLVAICRRSGRCGLLHIPIPSCATSSSLGSFCLFISDCSFCAQMRHLCHSVSSSFSSGSRRLLLELQQLLPRTSEAAAAASPAVPATALSAPAKHKAFQLSSPPQSSSSSLQRLSLQTSPSSSSSRYVAAAATATPVAEPSVPRSLSFDLSAGAAFDFEGSSATTASGSSEGAVAFDTEFFMSARQGEKLVRIFVRESLRLSIIPPTSRTAELRRSLQALSQRIPSSLYIPVFPALYSRWRLVGIAVEQYASPLYPVLDLIFS
jgi:hypothetical protein